jgi:hypothetical protein
VEGVEVREGAEEEGQEELRRRDVGLREAGCKHP